MNALDIQTVIESATPLVNGVLAVLVVFNRARLVRIEEALKSLSGHVHSEHCNPPRTVQWNSE